MRKENLFRNKATKGLVAALAVAMATTVAPVSADAASAKKVTIAKGDSVKKAGKKGSFKSNKKKVAKVNKNGKITAVKAGTAKITATTTKGKKVTYKVTVKKAPTISKKKVSVTAGNSKKVTINKNGAKYLKVSFKSSNTGVATVNKNGKITGVSAGTATVTATVKGRNKNYKRKVTVTVNAATTTPTDPTPTDPTPTDPTPEAQDLVVTQGTNLVAGNYNTVTIKSSVAKDATVSLGAAKIGTLYVESGSEYNIDAQQADIDAIEIVGSGQATAKATRVPLAPRFNFGANTALNKTKITVKAAAYFAGTTKLGSISVSASVNLYVENAVGQLSVEGNSAKVSLHGAVDELTVKGESASIGIYAAVTTMTVEGKAASVMVAKSIVVTTMTISAENVSVAGNGTVADLKVSAAGAVVKTAVTKATVDATVTTGAVIGGTTVSAGATVSNVAAVGGQTDTDPVTTITDGSSTNQGGTSNGSSGGSSGSSTNGNVSFTNTVNVYSNTEKITSTVGTEIFEIRMEDVKAYLNDASATTLKVYQGTTASATLTERNVNINSDGDKHSIKTAPKGTPYTLASFQGIYQYRVIVTVLGTNVAKVEVMSTAPSSITTRSLVTDTREADYKTEKVNSRTTKNVEVEYSRNNVKDTVSISIEAMKAAMNGYTNDQASASGKVTAIVNGQEKVFDFSGNRADLTGSYVAATYNLPNTNGLLVLSITDVTHDSATGYTANIRASVIDKTNATAGTVTLTATPN